MAVMRAVSALELLSLAVILTNRITVHNPLVTSTGGPVHGLLYISTIFLALILPIPRASKWLAAIPGIGGLVALWSTRWLGAGEEKSDLPPAGELDLTDEEYGSAVVIADGVTATLSSTSRIGPLNFTVPRGAITGVVGPNGAGKTTALRMMCGLVSPTSGSMEFLDDKHVQGRAVRVGALIDSPGLLPSLTARENLLVLTRLAEWPSKVADRALERVEMTYAANIRVDTFSLGMKQRLGLASALLGEPEVVILDEPTNGLDPRGKTEFREFLRELRRNGTTVILATHALEEVEELCDHLIAIDHGRVIFRGAPGEMLATIPETIRCRSEDASGLAAAAKAFAEAGYDVNHTEDAVHVRTGRSNGSHLNQIAAGAGTTLSEIAPVHATLEQALLRLTERTSSEPTAPRAADSKIGVSA
jgi:ABC-2 type transport system ATP-binding protein